MLSASQSLPPQRSDILKAEQDDTTRQLLAHVPNSLIYFDHTKNMPATKEFLGVVLFADISGFTKLTECYSTLETSADGTSGTDKLSATLNAYIGKIVEEIIQSNGDILKFAGDAILATWKCSDIGHNAKALLNKVINCSIDIQKKCHNFVTEVGIVLCVKLAIAVGPMCLTFVGLPTDKEFDLSGDAVDDVGLTEKQATPGAVILSQLAWANCDQSLFDVTPLKNNRFFKIIGHSQNNSKPEQIGDDETRGNNTLLQTINRSVTSPLDSLIDQVLDYTQDMPKALMLDEDEKVTTDIYLTQTVIEASKKEKDKKKNKFDRLTMTSNLTSSEIDNLRAYVATPVLDKLDNGQNLDWLSEMRQVSVLFINMKLPEPAHDASKALQKAFEVVNEACSKFQGNLNKLFGFDKGCTFVVIFGLPGQKHEDDPVRALKCALAIFDSLHSIQEIINESIGVTTGLAFTGVVGHKDRHEYTVIGSKVNMAARLMMFYPGLLTCDAETYEASKSRLRKHDFAVQPYIELKGMKDPGVVREYNPNSGKKDDEDDFDFPILGRKKELDQIDRLFEEHKHNVKSHVIVIEGDAGIGKTRLLEQIMDEGEKRRFRVIYVEGDLAQAQTSGYISNTVIKLIFELDSLERDFLFNAFKDDDEIMENLNLIKDLLGLASSSNIRIDQSENHNPDRYHYRRKMILKVITILSVQQPCLIAIDNARYIDEKSWSFFKDLAQQTQCMMAFSIRTMTSSPLSPIASDMIDSTNALRLDLAGLGQQYVVDFICQLLQVCEIPKKLHELIQKKSQGVPSWCEQLIKDALYANTIQVIAKPITEDQELLKPGHPDHKAFNKDFMNSHNFEVPISRPGSRRESSSQQQQRSSKTPKFDVLKNLTITSNKLEDQFVYKSEEYVSATEGVVPGENDEICIITPGADLKSVLQPDSVKDMVLARMDRMSLNEQTVLKCAAVLGQSFTRDLLTAIIPKNCVNMLDTTLYNLCKQQFFECGSLQLQSAQQRSQSSHTIMLENKTQQHHYHHHHGHGSIQNTQVLCACYSFEGYPLINLSQSNNYSDRKKRVCLYFHFCNTFVQEAAYALWLEDQRKSLMEKAALYLEVYSDKCRACGGNGFIPGHGRGMNAQEHVKCGTGRKFSMSVSLTEHARESRAFSHFYMAPENTQESPFANSATTSIQEEAARVFKNNKSEHIKNYEVQGTRGESIGLVLIEMARVLATNKEAATERPANRVRFGKSIDRTHRSSNKTITKLATRTLMMEFRSTQDSRRKSSVGMDQCDVDLSQCQCAELHAKILPQLVYYWRSSGNMLKSFQYMIDATAAAIDVNDTMRTTSLLKDMDEVVKKHTNNEDFHITDEEKAKIECLKGQSMCNMGFISEGIVHFQTSLQLLKCPQPNNWFSTWHRTWKAYLVQQLHLKMPGVFQENKRDQLLDFSMEQIHVLSFLSKAYTIQKEYDKAYLCNLEQLNLAEEASANYWNELLCAYTDMIVSCHIYRRFETGKSYEQLAKEMCKSASMNIDDLVSMGKYHLVLCAFHLANKNINAALDSGLRSHKVARSINDLNLKLSVIPLLVQIYLFKAKAQSCSDIMAEYKQLLVGLEDDHIKAIYFNCCMDQLLDTGDTLEEMSEITHFVKSRDNTVGSLMFNRLRVCISLWYARQESRILAPQFFTYFKIPDDVGDVEVQNEIFKIRFQLYRLECCLHQYRCRKSINNSDVKMTTVQNLNAVQDTVRDYKLFQARFIHYQAYYAVLRKKTNRAKLLLEDCKVVSKNMDGGFDNEWCLASLRKWFVVDGIEDLMENERRLSGNATGLSGAMKYVLPANV